MGSSCTNVVSKATSYKGEIARSKMEELIKVSKGQKVSKDKKIILACLWKTIDPLYLEDSTEISRSQIEHYLSHKEGRLSSSNNEQSQAAFIKDFNDLAKDVIKNNNNKEQLEEFMMFLENSMEARIKLLEKMLMR